MTNEQPRDRELSPEVVSFLEDMIDSRASTIAGLKETFDVSETISHDYNGCSTFPDTLSEFIDTSRPASYTLHARTIQSEDDERQPGKIKLIIEPYDRLPFTISHDHGIETIEQGDKALYDSSGQVFRATLESFFATTVHPSFLKDIPTSKLLEAISALSPRNEVYLAKNIQSSDGGSITISSVQREDIDDSLELISIEHVRQHVSGTEIGTRLRISESMKQRTLEPLSLSHQTDAVVPHGASISIEGILEEKEAREIPISRITRYHISDIYDALDAFRRAQP